MAATATAVFWKELAMSTQTLPRVSTRGRIGHFMLHYFEMCVPMCVGFAVLDLVYYWAAGLAGYTNPFTTAAHAVRARGRVQHDRADGGVHALPRHAPPRNSRDVRRDGHLGHSACSYSDGSRSFPKRTWR